MIKRNCQRVRNQGNVVSTKHAGPMDLPRLPVGLQCVDKPAESNFCLLFWPPRQARVCIRQGCELVVNGRRSIRDCYRHCAPTTRLTQQHWPAKSVRARVGPGHRHRRLAALLANSATRIPFAALDPSPAIKTSLEPNGPIGYPNAMVLACTAAGSRFEKCSSTPPSCNTVRA